MFGPKPVPREKPPVGSPNMLSAIFCCCNNFLTSFLLLNRGSGLVFVSCLWIFSYLILFGQSRDVFDSPALVTPPCITGHFPLLSFLYSTLILYLLVYNYSKVKNKRQTVNFSN